MRQPRSGGESNFLGIALLILFIAAVVIGILVVLGTVLPLGIISLNKSDDAMDTAEVAVAIARGQDPLFFEDVCLTDGVCQGMCYNDTMCPGIDTADGVDATVLCLFNQCIYTLTPYSWAVPDNTLARIAAQSMVLDSEPLKQCLVIDTTTSSVNGTTLATGAQAVFGCTPPPSDGAFGTPPP